MGRRIVLILLALIVGAVAYINTRPTNFHIERSAKINAPSAVVFPLINDLHQWVKWSPFEKLDPNMKKTFSGPDSGAGAAYAWAGNAQAGEGRMTIIDSKPNDMISMKLEFMKPMAATDRAAFRLVPDGDDTRVTWSMDGQHNFLGKTFSTFMNMDKMVGTSFEEGLAKLDTLAQAAAQKAAPAAP